MTTKLLMYVTLVRLIIDCAATVWSPHNQSNIIKLQAVQNEAVRFIFQWHDRYPPPSHFFLPCAEPNNTLRTS